VRFGTRQLSSSSPFRSFGASAGAAGFPPGGGALFAVSADSADGVVLLPHQASGNRGATLAGQVEIITCLAGQQMK